MVNVVGVPVDMINDMYSIIVFWFHMLQLILFIIHYSLLIINNELPMIYCFDQLHYSVTRIPFPSSAFDGSLGVC